MADTSSTVLRLVFGTEVEGKTASMEFNNPKADVTQAQIEALMNLIITKNVVNTKNDRGIEALHLKKASQGSEPCMVRKVGVSVSTQSILDELEKEFMKI